MQNLLIICAFFVLFCFVLYSHMKILPMLIKIQAFYSICP